MSEHRAIRRQPRLIALGLLLLFIGAALVYYHFFVCIHDGVIDHFELETVKIVSVQGFIRLFLSGLFCMVPLGLSWLLLYPQLFRSRPSAQARVPAEAGIPGRAGVPKVTLTQTGMRICLVVVGLIFLLPGLLAVGALAWYLADPASAPSFLDENVQALIGLSPFLLIGLFLVIRAATASKFV